MTTFSSFLLERWVSVIVLVTLVNFSAAIFLKDALRMTFRQNKGIKYFFIVPPFAIMTWVVSFIYLILSKIIMIIKEYFED